MSKKSIYESQQHLTIKYFVDSMRIKGKSLIEILRALKRNRLTFTALIVLLSLFFIAIIAPIIIPFPSHVYRDVNPKEKLLPPSKIYFFGTDEAGRDIFSRVVFGTRISLFASVISITIAVIIGIPLGLLAGYYGGFIDEFIMRIVDIILSFPVILSAMVIASILGPSLENGCIAIIIAWSPWYTRLIRGQVVSLKEREFVRAAKAIGTSSGVIMFRHMLPNCFSPIMVQASMDLGSCILTLASLSFLGLGAQVPIPEWGLMINISRTYFLEAWWYSIFPGIFIFISVLSFNILGDGMREVLDPKTNK